MAHQGLGACILKPACIRTEPPACVSDLHAPCLLFAKLFQVQGAAGALPLLSHLSVSASLTAFLFDSEETLPS